MVGITLVLGSVVIAHGPGKGKQRAREGADKYFDKQKDRRQFFDL
ncbi:hypothetical protein [Ferrimonas balearica]|nr:hypothetical protein [Ferrimonas balearica]